MVKVPPGKTKMRDDRINRNWEVRIDSFYMSSTPVTQWLYHKAKQENPSTFIGEHLPVESISWQEAISFCNALSILSGLAPYYIIDQNSGVTDINCDTEGFRLPSESEWQYACQAGDTSIRYGDIDAIAWYKENSRGSTQIVGSKQPNAWGLFDMLGNVWEWCSDIYDEKVYGSYRIFRGGGWSDEKRSVMATTRRRSHPKSFKIDDLGFRIAKNL
jgi:formylglycine-generating enzyme required for sulfatase activity